MIAKKVGERLLPHSVRAELRPILVFTGTGAALWDGSRELVRRAWNAAGTRLGTGERLGALALGVYAIGYECCQAPAAAVGFAVPAAIAAWCVAAWTVAPPAEPEQPEQPEGDDEAEAQPARGPQEVYTATLEWIRGQIGDANGVHLSQLLAHAQAHGMHTGLDVPAFRAALERHGFPIRQQLKVGRRNRPGIHRDDLPEPLPSAPSPEETGEPATPVGYPV